MGLHGAGKSTFIGALWHILESKEIPSTLMMEAEPDNREYLNELREAWLEFRIPGRTSTQLFKPLEFQIKETGKDEVFTFTFPDLSGEMYESQFEHRKLSPEYLKSATTCCGILVFINPDGVRAPNLIVDVDNIDKAFSNFFGQLQQQAEKEKKGAPDAQKFEETDENKLSTLFKEIKWQHKYSQSQVKLIDILQMIIPLINKPCKVAFIISAWDVIIKANKQQLRQVTPAIWLAEQVPLLHQFITSNADIFSYEVFGVSAQGGSYDKKAVEELYKVNLPSDRVVVQHNDEVGKDITLPIKWLLNE